MRRSPAAGSACSAQKSAPVSRRTFCSSESAASRPLDLGLVDGGGGWRGLRHGHRRLRVWGGCGRGLVGVAALAEDADVPRAEARRGCAGRGCDGARGGRRRRPVRRARLASRTSCGRRAGGRPAASRADWTVTDAGRASRHGSAGREVAGEPARERAPERPVGDGPDRRHPAASVTARGDGREPSEVRVVVAREDLGVVDTRPSAQACAAPAHPSPVTGTSGRGSCTRRSGRRPARAGPPGATTGRMTDVSVRVPGARRQDEVAAGLGVAAQQVERRVVRDVRGAPPPGSASARRAASGSSGSWRGATTSTPIPGRRTSPGTTPRGSDRTRPGRRTSCGLSGERALELQRPPALRATSSAASAPRDEARPGPPSSAATSRATAASSAYVRPGCSEWPSTPPQYDSAP